MTNAPVSLSGVSETALLTLDARAREARRTDSMIDDPMAIKLRDAIDYDYGKFGRARRQDIALRALTFDSNTRRYLSTHPAATVVALAEGLQTTFYRIDATVDSDDFRWLTVDLPPIIDVRRQLLPESPRVSLRAQSALDFSWMDDVDPANGVAITAEGLLMYLPPDEAMSLISECASRFPGGQMLFDLPPTFVATLSRRGLPLSFRYKVPPMPFALSVSALANLVNTMPGVRAVHDLPLAPGRGGVTNAILSTVQRVPLFDVIRPTITLLEFG